MSRATTRQHAILPESLEPATIAGMLIDETTYTVPWGMWVDSERRCWLHPDYHITSRPFGTSEMMIQRHEDGFEVWVPAGWRGWSPEDQPSYVGGEGKSWLPVVTLNP